MDYFLIEIFIDYPVVIEVLVGRFMSEREIILHIWDAFTCVPTQFVTEELQRWADMELLL